MKPFTIALLTVLVAVLPAHAEPLCAPTDDPCVVDRPILVSADEAGELDLGLRALHIVGSGRLILPDGGAIRCGALRVATDGALAIDARGGVTDDLYGPDVWILVQRTCSDAPATACTSDLNCAAGTCSVGDGSVLFEGAYRSNGVPGRSLRIFAAGPAALVGLFDVSSESIRGHGPDFFVTAGDGDLRVTGTIRANFGDSATEGEIELSAARDLHVDATITKNSMGGYNVSGGTIELRAGNDAIVKGRVEAQSRARSGDGGDVDIRAGRDLHVDDARVRSDAGGPYQDDGAGEGGTQRYIAGRNLQLGRNLRARSNGGGAYGFGGIIEATAGANLVFAGRAETNGNDTAAHGGEIRLGAETDLDVQPTARLIARGTRLNPYGLVEIQAGGDLRFDGRIVAHSFEIAGAASVDVAGGARTSRAYYCRVDACSATIRSGAKLSCDENDLEIRVEQGLTVEEQSSLTARQGGAVVLAVPAAATPIVLEGHVAPDPQIVEDATLALCAQP